MQIHLHVEPSGTRHWVQRLVIHGKAHALGLGSFHFVPLAEAREQALANRRVARAGGDPRAASRRADGMPTFEEAAAKVIAINGAAWRAGSGNAHRWRPVPTEHRRALPHAEVAGVAGAVAAVCASTAWTGVKLAFEFLVLTAARSAEVGLVTWEEIDLDSLVWAIPASRMKTAREHRYRFAAARSRFCSRRGGSASTRPPLRRPT